MEMDELNQVINNSENDYGSELEYGYGNLSSTDSVYEPASSDSVLEPALSDSLFNSPVPSRPANGFTSHMNGVLVRTSFVQGSYMFEILDVEDEEEQ